MRATPPTLLTRRSVIAGAAAATASAATGCGGGSAPPVEAPADAVTYLTNFGQLGRDAYSYLALEHGFFADAGLEVTIEPGTGTQGNLRALLGGQAEFVTVDLAGAIVSRGRGLDGFTALAAIQQRNLAAIMSLDPELTHPLDLAGRSVGLPPGAITELLFPAYAQVAGLDPDEVEVVPVDPPNLAGALASGQVDAVGQFVVGRPLVEAAAGGRPVSILAYDEYLGDLYGVCLLTSTALAEEDPDLCLRFRDALLRGLDYSLEHPDQAAAALTTHNPAADPEVAAEELRLMDPYARPQSPNAPLGVLEEARVMQSIAILRSIGAVDDASLLPADLVSFDLAPRP